MRGELIQVLRNTSHVLKLQQNTPLFCRKRDERERKEGREGKGERGEERGKGERGEGKGRERRGEREREERGKGEKERRGKGERERRGGKEQIYSEIDACTCDVSAQTHQLFFFTVLPSANC